MQLFQAWAESLTLFKPQNFKLFLLVTLKSILETYKVLFTRFWPVMVAPLVIVAIYLLMEYELGYYRLHEIIPGPLWVVSLFVLFPLFWYMLVFLCARPSAGLKDWPYVLSYKYHFIYFCLFALAASACMMTLLSDINVTFIVIIRIYAIFFTAFLLDSDARIKAVGLSLIRSGKMMVYNLPFVIVCAIVFVCLTKIPSYFYVVHPLHSSMFYEPIVIYVRLFLLPIFVCFLMNFYVKKIHEQFNLYFPVKGQ